MNGVAPKCDSLSKVLYFDNNIEKMSFLSQNYLVF